MKHDGSSAYWDIQLVKAKLVVFFALHLHFQTAVLRLLVIYSNSYF